MRIWDGTFDDLWSEALQSKSREIYVSEWSASSIWPEGADLAVVANKMGEIWDGAHMSARDLWRRSGLTQAAFATRFCIPKRTVEDWCRVIASPPPYVRLLLLEALGIVSRDLEGVETTKYAVIDATTGDWFEEIFDSEAEAIDYADAEWAHMSAYDKKRRAEYYVARGEMGEYGEFDLNTAEIIKKYK